MRPALRCTVLIQRAIVSVQRQYWPSITPLWTDSSILEQSPVVEKYKTLLDVAKRQTGLDDFGADSFREGLEILVNALRREANLNARGEAVLRERIIGHLSQRLQVEDWYRRYPEIDDVPLVAPLIGISLPRTGSTVLSFLLAQDPDARSLRRAEAARPCPPPAMVSDAAAARRAAGRRPTPRDSSPMCRPGRMRPRSARI